MEFGNKYAIFIKNSRRSFHILPIKYSPLVILVFRQGFLRFYRQKALRHHFLAIPHKKLYFFGLKTEFFAKKLPNIEKIIYSGDKPFCPGSS